MNISVLKRTYSTSIQDRASAWTDIGYGPCMEPNGVGSYLDPNGSFSTSTKDDASPWVDPPDAGLMIDPDGAIPWVDPTGATWTSARRRHGVGLDPNG